MHAHEQTYIIDGNKHMIKNITMPAPGQVELGARGMGGGGGNRVDSSA